MYVLLHLQLDAQKNCLVQYANVWVVFNPERKRDERIPLGEIIVEEANGGNALAEEHRKRSSRRFILKPFCMNTRVD